METIIESPRLAFRRLRAEDLDDLSKLYADPEVRRYFPDGALTRTKTSEQLDFFLSGNNDGFPEHGLWAVIERASGNFIGRCGLLQWTIEDRQETEIAYMIARDHWRRGFGEEAAKALVRHGFETLRLPRLIALIDPGNLPSIRTAEKAGLRFERVVDVHGPVMLYAIRNLQRSA